MMWHRFGYGGCGWGGMAIMIVFWVIVIALIIGGAVRMGRHGYWMHGDRHGSNALDIAKERYAKGEINQEEYEQIKKNLS